MSVLLRGAATVVVFLLSPCMAPAQPAATQAASQAASSLPASQPGIDPRELLRTAQAEALKVKSFTYEAVLASEGPMSEKAARGRGRVRGQRTDVPGQPLLRVDGTIRMPNEAEPREIDLVLNDQQAVSIDARRKEFTHGDAAGSSMLLMPVQFFAISPLLAPNPYADEMNAKTLSIEPPQVVEGVACHVVRLEFGANTPVVRWFFGKQDSLPRRIERTFDNPMFKGSVSLTLSRLDVKTEHPDALFRPTPPEGFKNVEFDPPGALLKVGKPAPDWAIKTPDGETVRLSGLRGRVVLMDFWATWCGPCKLAMPGVQKLYEKFKDRPVSIFGISTWERGDPAAYMKAQKLTYPLLVKGDETAAAYHVTGIPTFYLIGPDGKILHASSGYDPTGEARLTALIEKALKSAPATAPASAAASAPSR